MSILLTKFIYNISYNKIYKIGDLIKLSLDSINF